VDYYYYLELEVEGLEGVEGLALSILDGQDHLEILLVVAHDLNVKKFH